MKNNRTWERELKVSRALERGGTWYAMDAYEIGVLWRASEGMSDAIYIIDRVCAIVKGHAYVCFFEKHGGRWYAFGRSGYCFGVVKGGKAGFKAFLVNRLHFIPLQYGAVLNASF